METKERQMNKMLRKISDFPKKARSMKTTKMKLKPAASYKPATRLEKIKQKRMIYPASTEDKFIFVSNLDGAGFQREVCLSCPQNIPIDDMLQEINVECYKQWEKNREHSESNPFWKLQKITNIEIILFFIFGFALYIFNQNQSNFISSFLYVFLVFIVMSTVMSLVAFCQSAEHYDCDWEMIKAIKNILDGMNRAERQVTGQRPKFEWSCHKECLWICLKVLRRNSVDGFQIEQIP